MELFKQAFIQAFEEGIELFFSPFRGFWRVIRGLPPVSADPSEMSLRELTNGHQVMMWQANFFGNRHTSLRWRDHVGLLPGTLDERAFRALIDRVEESETIDEGLQLGESTPRSFSRSQWINESRRRLESEEERKRGDSYREQREAIRRLVHAELAEAASPTPYLTPDGRLDAGPNVAYDVPIIDNELISLPIRQRALVQTILKDLPENAPRYLVVALRNYEDELRVRGVQPLLGLLKDMVAIIQAAVSAADSSQEWLSEGMRIAFDLFAQNHTFLVRHFPLDPKRDELYARTRVGETSASATTFSKPFQDVAFATLEANRAGITTGDFVKIVDKLAEFAKIIGSIPPMDDFEDRVATATIISPKKRILLSAFGFFERCYNLLNSTTALVALPEGNRLLKTLHEANAVLSKVIAL